MPPSTSPTQNDPRQSPQKLGLWDQTAATEEMFGAWTCAWSAWADYLNRLATASGPDAVFAAGNRLMTDSLEICSRATAGRLRAAGLRSPLLNDA
jgi:hypothetical protein